jgi:hypothetical protein
VDFLDRKYYPKMPRPFRDVKCEVCGETTKAGLIAEHLQKYCKSRENNVPDERLRAAAMMNEAREFANSKEFKEFCSLIHDSAMREAAGLVCQYCAVGACTVGAIKRGVAGYPDCAAKAIHERLEQKEKG